MTGTLVSAVEWKSDDFDGHETCRLSRLVSGWELAGEFHGVELGEEYALEYTVQMDDDWRARLLRLRCASQSTKARTCTLTATSEGVWKQKTGNTLPDLWDVEGLFLVDLDFSPAMRTQLVRHLQLEIDETRSVDLIQILVPELELTPGFRIVTRTSEDSYRCGYNYLGVSDELTFSVDEHGLVTDDEMGMIHVVD